MDFENVGDSSAILFMWEFLTKYKENMLEWIGVS